MPRKIVIHCPPMPVLATGWWPLADREAQEEHCTGEIEGLGGLTCTFPKCRVRRVGMGRWMVDAVVMVGYLDTGEEIRVSFPPEPILRDGWNMVAQPVKSIAGLITRHDGTVMPVDLELPLAVGRPVGLGLQKFIVEAVDVTGTVFD